MARALALPTESRIDLGPMALRADIRPDSIDKAARTVEVVFSTGAGVERYDWMSGTSYIETLGLKPGQVRLDRLNAGAPFLNAHSAYDLEAVLGTVIEARIENGLGIAKVRMSRREKVAPIWQDIQDGILRNVSVGYRVHKYEHAEASEGKPAVRHAVDWEPFEISAVPIPADAGAQVRTGERPPNATPCVIVRAASSASAPQHKEPLTMKTRAQVEPDADGNCPEGYHKSEDGTMCDPDEERAAGTGAEPTDRQVGVTHERERTTGILRAVRNGGLPTTFADTFIKDGTSLVDAQAAVLERVNELSLHDKGPNPGPSRVSVDDGGRERALRAGMENALLARVAPQYFKLDDLGKRYVHLTALEAAKLCLEARGMRTTGMSRMQVAGLALEVRAGYHTTSDFPNILENVANKTLRRAYDESPATYTAVARRVELPDFKMVSRNELGEFPGLLEVKEHGEFTSGTIGEGKEQYQLKTYGRKFGLSRQALVNDDLDSFSRLAMMAGRQARMLEADLVWAQITGNPTMGDGVALFHANHANISGSAGAIAIATLGAGRAIMRKQTGLDGTTKLNLAPRYLVVPVALETIAQQFTTQITPAAGADVNPFAQGLLQVIAEPRLDDTSATVWYLFASTDQTDIVEYAFLAGESGPVLEMKPGFDIDGIDWKVRHDVAAKIIGWRGAYRNAA